MCENRILEKKLLALALGKDVEFTQEEITRLGLYVKCVEAETSRNPAKSFKAYKPACKYAQS
jgi:hypothetical protein